MEGENTCKAENQAVHITTDTHTDETMMTIHFHADLRPVVKECVGMLHWIIDPACSGFIIAYELGGNHVLISNCDVIFPFFPLHL